MKTPVQRMPCRPRTRPGPDGSVQAGFVERSWMCISARFMNRLAGGAPPELALAALASHASGQGDILINLRQWARRWRSWCRDGIGRTAASRTAAAGRRLAGEFAGQFGGVVGSASRWCSTGAAGCTCTAIGNMNSARRTICDDPRRRRRTWTRHGCADLTGCFRVTRN